MLSKQPNKSVAAIASFNNAHKYLNNDLQTYKSVIRKIIESVPPDEESTYMVVR